MILEEEFNNYNENGYIIKKILSEEDCNKIINYVNCNNKYAFYETNTNIKFGYQHEIDPDSPVINILNNNTNINSIIKNILGEYDISIIRSYNKDKFISRDIEYHQEFYNNALLPSNGNYEDYVQVFVALENHSLENGCLKIFPKSHKEGLLPYKDIINSNIEHKRTVDYNSLVDCYNKYGIINCELKKGEAVIFNHLIIHGSQNNNSPFSRKALVITFNKKNLIINKKNKDNYLKFRNEFVINKLKTRINNLNI